MPELEVRADFGGEAVEDRDCVFEAAGAGFEDDVVDAEVAEGAELGDHRVGGAAGGESDTGAERQGREIAVRVAARLALDRRQWPCLRIS